MALKKITTHQSIKRDKEEMNLKTTYNCIIMENERFARDLIADYLKNLPEFTIAGKYKT